MLSLDGKTSSRFVCLVREQVCQIKLIPSVLCLLLFILIAPSVAQATEVFAIDFAQVQADILLKFDTGSPNTQTVIDPTFSPPLRVFALDFDSSATTLFGLDNLRVLGKIDTTNGDFVDPLDVTGILSNHNIVGMSLDPTTNTFFIYSVSGFGGTSPGALYTLDTVTGVATLIGKQGVARLVTDIAINGAGEIFANDIATDSLYSIDKATGAATLIGPLGADISGGGQGMDFDFTTDTLYAVLSGGGQSNFGTIDVTTGTFTPVADFSNQGAMEIALAASVPVREVDIDINIKPGSDPNCINLSSSGVIPVAILSSESFDATTVDGSTLFLASAPVKLAGSGINLLCHEEDVAGAMGEPDGLPDLVCHIEVAEFMIEVGSATAVLEGKTFDGDSIRGEDGICIVPDN